MQKEVDIIIEKIALKHRLPKQVVSLIFDSQLRTTRDIIKDSIKNNHKEIEVLPVVMWPKWGKFIPNMKRFNKVKEFIGNNIKD